MLFDNVKIFVWLRIGWFWKCLIFFVYLLILFWVFWYRVLFLLIWFVLEIVVCREFILLKFVNFFVWFKKGWFFCCCSFLF